MKQDLYTVLGVSPDATDEALQKAAHGALSVTSDSAQRVLIRHARDTLCDPQRRAAYDQSLKAAAPSRTGMAVPLPPTTQPSASPFSNTAVRPRGPAPQEAAPPWRLWLGVASLVLVVGGVGYQLGKPKSPPPSNSPVVVAASQTRSSGVPTGSARTHTASPIAAGGQHQGESTLSPETLYATVAPSVVVIESLGAGGQAVSRGSGVVIGSELVLTNCHVVAQASAVRVRAGSIEFVAMGDTSDTQLDLCQLRVPGLGAPAVLRGTVKEVRVGQTVFAIGTPHDLERTLSQGLVSALRDTPDGTLIQTSASISPGSSGGGLFDNQGRLIGITTFQHKQGQNLNFALPVDFIDIMRNR